MLFNKYLDLNYYESEYYKITIFNNKLPDLFYIYLENEIVIIERFDKNIGWGQDLKLLFRNKITKLDYIINIGSSNENIKKNTIPNNYILLPNNENFHYENEKCKIFYISEQYNDIFKIDYIENDKIIKIKRIDKNENWGQDLKLKYIKKDSNKVKIINIGSSTKNSIDVHVDINKIKYKDLFNYYESNNYIITIFESEFSDIFFINFFEETRTLYIKRIDSNEGWGQNLKLNIFDIKQNHNFIIYIGQCINNDIYKKINLIIRKCYVALTTIPSRIVLPIFKENIIHFLNSQTYPIENMFITIAHKYKRFTETIIKSLQEIPKVILILLDVDLGPASKYMGPLLNYYDYIKNNLLIVIDDDRKYNTNLLRNFTIGYNSYSNIIFSSGIWKNYFDKNYVHKNDNFLEYSLYKELNDYKFHYGQGLGGFFGFCIKVHELEKFIKYNFDILNRIEKSIYHDEGIILGYLKKQEELIIYINHKGCNIIENELVDALFTSSLVDRGHVEKEILQITNMENILD